MENNTGASLQRCGIEGTERHNEGILMSVKEMGETLGLKKTERYRLMHMGLFETTVFLGRMMIVRESFEKWYASQVRYRKVNGEEPGSELKAWSYSIQDISGMLGIHPATVYALISRDRIETVKVDYSTRVPKDVFERWYEGQDRYRKIDLAVKQESGRLDEAAGLRRGMEKPPVGSEYITVDEAIRISGFSRTSLSGWIRAGCFPVEKVGRSVRIRRGDFEEWLCCHKTAGKGERTWHQ